MTSLPLLTTTIFQIPTSSTRMVTTMRTSSVTSLASTTRQRRRLRSPRWTTRTSSFSRSTTSPSPSKTTASSMVKLYVPWCSHYQALTPKYTVAATELKPNSVILTKVNAIVEKNWRASTMFMVSPPSSSSSMGFTSPTLAKEPSKTRCTFWIFQFRSQLSVIAF